MFPFPGWIDSTIKIWTVLEFLKEKIRESFVENT